MAASPQRLSQQARAWIADPEVTVFLSMASCWEMAIKYALQKLNIVQPPETFIPSLVAYHRLTLLPVELRHVFEVTRLAHHHRDPFDRMLIAQARLERLPILTADRRFDRYEVETLRA